MIASRTRLTILTLSMAAALLLRPQPSLSQNTCTLADPGCQTKFSGFALSDTFDVKCPSGFFPIGGGADCPVQIGTRVTVLAQSSSVNNNGWHAECRHLATFELVAPTYIEVFCARVDLPMFPLP